MKLTPSMLPPMDARYSRPIGSASNWGDASCRRRQGDPVSNVHLGAGISCSTDRFPSGNSGSCIQAMPTMAPPARSVRFLKYSLMRVSSTHQARTLQPMEALMWSASRRSVRVLASKPTSQKCTEGTSRETQPTQFRHLRNALRERRGKCSRHIFGLAEMH